MIRRPPRSTRTDTLFPYTTLFRSGELNFLQTEVSYDGRPATIRGNARAPFYCPRYSTSSNIAYYGDNTILQLPVYVCPRETQGACTAANGTLNPNDPYADQGQTAAVIGRLPNLTEHNESRTRAYRFAAEIGRASCRDRVFTCV